METVTTDFWCDNCDMDLNKQKAHIVRRSGFKLYVCHCPDCSKELLRFPKEGGNDIFYGQSRKTLYQARKYRDDFLQPDDPRFHILYPQYKRENSQ